MRATTQALKRFAKDPMFSTAQRTTGTLATSAAKSMPQHSHNFVQKRPFSTLGGSSKNSYRGSNPINSLVRQTKTQNGSKSDQSSGTYNRLHDFLLGMGIVAGSTAFAKLSSEYSGRYDAHKATEFMKSINTSSSHQYTQAEARRLNADLTSQNYTTELKYKTSPQKHYHHIQQFFSDNIEGYHKTQGIVAGMPVAGMIRGSTSLITTPSRNLMGARIRGEANGGYIKFLNDMRNIGLKETFKYLYRGFPAVAKQGFKVGAFVTPAVNIMKKGMTSEETKLQNSTLVLNGIIQTFGAATVELALTGRNDHNAISMMNGVKPIENLMSKKGLLSYVIPAFGRYSLISAPAVISTTLANQNNWSKREKNTFTITASILAGLTTLPIDKVIMRASSNQSCAPSEINKISNTMKALAPIDALQYPFRGGIPRIMIVIVNNLALTAALESAMKIQKGYER